MDSLRNLRKSKGVLQQDVAEYIGITASAYGHYETGRRQPPPDVLLKLSEYFGVSVDDILTGKPDISSCRPIMMKPELELVDDVIRVPVVASLRCGFGRAGEPFHLIKYIQVPADYSRYGENLAVIIASGDSMAPTISPGAYLVCVPGDAWEDGQIVAVDINDADTIKRIYHAPGGGIRLVPDNPAYVEQVFTPADIDRLHIRVLGRIRKAISPDL